jgi:predicted nucleic acid-binding protein
MPGQAASRREHGAAHAVRRVLRPRGPRIGQITPEVVETATALRAAHGFRPPDAIHLATAILAKADVFLTGDRNLARCPGLKVEVLAGPRSVS